MIKKKLLTFTLVLTLATTSALTGYASEEMSNDSAAVSVAAVEETKESETEESETDVEVKETENVTETSTDADEIESEAQTEEAIAEELLEIGAELTAGETAPEFAEGTAPTDSETQPETESEPEIKMQSETESESETETQSESETQQETTSESETEKICKDEAVQTAYTILQNIVKVFADAVQNNMDLSMCETIVSDLNNLNIITMDFTEEQEAAWQTVVESNMGLEAYINNIYSAGLVSELLEAYNNFCGNQNIRTALKFVDALSLVRQEIGIDFVGTISEWYSAAFAILPSDNAKTIYNSFSSVQSAMESMDIEGLKTAVEDFYSNMDLYNNLTEEEKEELAVLFEQKGAAEVFDMILSDWITANVIVQTDEIYTAYISNPNQETAKEFVEYYDSIFNDPDSADEEQQALISTFFMDIEAVYDDAKSMLEEENTGTEIAGTAEPEPETETETESVITTETNASAAETESGSNTAPLTGDETPILAVTGMMFLAAAAMLELKRRRV